MYRMPYIYPLTFHSIYFNPCDDSIRYIFSYIWVKRVGEKINLKNVNSHMNDHMCMCVWRRRRNRRNKTLCSQDHNKFEYYLKSFQWLQSKTSPHKIYWTAESAKIMDVHLPNTTSKCVDCDIKWCFHSDSVNLKSCYNRLVCSRKNKILINTHTPRRNTQWPKSVFTKSNTKQKWFELNLKKKKKTKWKESQTDFWFWKREEEKNHKL